ncbi:MAG TPA: efflux RND transporter periplasmic adaptor subunit [Vicinamibacterales bacterium]|nr:efflux RND transporter periplasmic adaptor subunit [Vicinamibacterales bacterium]
MPRIRLTRRRVVLALAAAALVASFVWAFAPAPVPVDIAVVARGPLVVTVDEEGETRVRDRFIVSAPVPGRMLRITLEPGDPVTADRTVVARILPSDPTLLDVRTRSELEARARAARSAVEGARAERDRLATDLKFARRDLQRREQLAKEGLTSTEQLEAVQRQVRTLEEALRSAEFAVTTAEFQRETAEAALLTGRRADPRAALEIRSPVDGVLLREIQESETVVQPGQPLVEIGDLQRMEIVSDLLSTDAVKVRPGQRVIIDQWGGDRPLAGRVRLVEPSGFMKISALGVEEQRVNVIIDFDDPAEAAKYLGDNYRVEVRIVIWEAEDVLKVPVSSLFRAGGGWAVYRVEDDTAYRRPVEIGRQNTLEAQVTSGLAEGDRIVVYPSDDVADGVAIRERER